MNLTIVNLISVTKCQTVLLLILSLFSIRLLSATECNCDYTIKLSQKNVDGISANIKPGDTVCIESGKREILRLNNFHGDSLNYIVVKNCGGLVEIANNYSYGVNICNCSFIKFTGTGDSELKYGIKISGSISGANALSADMFSTNYEIDHVEICNAGFAGIMAQTQPSCDELANRGNFVQRNTSIHDNYIHNTRGEGFYIGSSSFNGINKTCDGVTKMLYPHEIKGLKVYDNILDSCGYDGIQVCCVTEDCEIYNNVVTNYGTKMVTAQHTGIQIGAGTTGLCYNNLIMNGSGTGIMVFGTGNNNIFNNIIINPGYNFFPDDPTVRIYGIFCDDRATIPGAPFNFINNTIISPKSDGIRIYSKISRNNKIYNNAIIAPGAFGLYYIEDQCYINYDKRNVDLDIQNNFFQELISSEFSFGNLQEVNSFCNTLALRKKGKNVNDLGLNFDYNFQQRPITGNCDIGAIEFSHSENLSSELLFKRLPLTPKPTENESFSEKVIDATSVAEIRLYPNPCRGNFAIHAIGDNLINHITIKNAQGMIVSKEIPVNGLFLNVGMKNGLTKGTYLVLIETKKHNLTRRIIVL